MKSTKYIKGLILLISNLTVFAAQAQDAAAPIAPVATQPSSGNYTMYMLLGTVVVLLLIIAVLGQVLIRLTLYIYENKSKFVKSVLLLLMLGVGSHSIFAQDAATTAAPAASAASVWSMDLIVALTVVLTEAFVIAILLIRILALINAINPRTQASKQLKFELPRWFDRFNESVAVEHEKDIMLDHDYDGIKELDNQLPPWWKWGFVFTIIWAISYFSYYHVFHAGPLSGELYTNEMADAKAAKDAYMKTAKNNVDENTVVFDASYVSDGQKIFTDNCVACHGSKGEGGVGPNLTDNYWLHGGKINDIFKTIKYGWPANGMKSWQSDFSAVQIAQLASYVKSLKGTNPPNPKDPQGDLYNEDGGANNATTSAAVKDMVSK